jgi:RluA family pseudouridine synthase
VADAPRAFYDDVLRGEHCPVRLIAPYAHTYQFRVKPSEVVSGLTLLDFLCRRFPYRSPEAWKARIGDGRIRCNDGPAEATQRLAGGDRITHHNPRVIEPSVPDEVRILEDTPDYLLVHKPAPMPVHPGGRYNKNTLTHILAEKGHSGLHVLHRLDAVTSGLLLLGKTPAFSRRVMQAFQAQEVEKVYHAEVIGQPSETDFSCDVPVLRDQGFRFRCATEKERVQRFDLKPAHTDFRVMAPGPDGRSLVECRPRTGRTHQIRLHLAECGHPIYDDLIYNNREHHNGATQQIQRFAISLKHVYMAIPELGLTFDYR